MPTHQVSQAEAAAHLRRVVESLPAELRTLVELRFGFNGREHSWKRIGAVFGVSPKKVQEAWHCARRAMTYEPGAAQIDLGLAALKRPSPPRPQLREVVERVERLTP